MTQSHTPNLYYIRNKHAGYLGNAPTWYGKNGRGYTAYILGAHRFTEIEALRMVNEDPTKWEMFKCQDVDKRLHLVFDIQDAKKLGTNEPCGWESGYAPNPHSNAHDDLVAVVQERIRCIELEAHNSGDDPTAIDNQYDDLRAALAKARGA